MVLDLQYKRQKRSNWWELKTTRITANMIVLNPFTNQIIDENPVKTLFPPRERTDSWRCALTAQRFCVFSLWQGPSMTSAPLRFQLCACRTWWKRGPLWTWRPETVPTPSGCSACNQMPSLTRIIIIIPFREWRITPNCFSPISITPSSVYFANLGCDMS